MATMLASRAPTRDPFLDPALPTLADVLATLDRPELAGRRDLADLRSAVRTVARVLGLPAEAVPAHPGHLRQRLAQVAPAAYGLRPSRWANVRSLLGKALRLAGAELLPGRATAPFTPVWRDLADRLKVRALRIGLGRLMRFCSAQGIAPEAVDDAVLDRFHTALEQASLVRNPRKAHQETVRCWNLAAASVPNWPVTQLTVPRYAKPYVLPLTAFPESFRQDFANWLARLAGEDLLAELPFRPVRPATLVHRHMQIRQLASALVRRGRDPASVGGLADLIEPAALREALRFFLDRTNGRSTRQIHELARTALTIARHWVKVPKAQEQTLQALLRRCDPGERGLAPKNRVVLRRLEDPTLVRALLTLPDQLACGLERKAKLTGRDAQRLQTALAIAILLTAPLRVGNLTGLRLDRHVVRQGQGAAQRVRLVIPAEEVKNRQELDYPLPTWVVALLDLYLARARPLLQRQLGPWLFPGAGSGGGPKQRGSMNLQISAAAETILGLRLTPHQFRHACGAIYLAANPGGHEVVRNLLGHRSIETTIRYYAGMEATAALRHYDTIIVERRQAGEGRHG